MAEDGIATLASILLNKSVFLTINGMLLSSTEPFSTGSTVVTLSSLQTSMADNLGKSLFVHLRMFLSGGSLLEFILYGSCGQKKLLVYQSYKL